MPQTTTLSAIGVTCLSGGCVLFVCFIAFEIALRKQNSNIAPRCSARPVTTIQNGFAQEFLPDHVQHRCGGNWIKWVMSLDYTTLLKGVPGTGTRQGGLSGSMLHVTLDSIVLLRFHALGRKLTMLATLLCLGLLLPLYLTTPQQQWLEIPNENCTSASTQCSNFTLKPYYHSNLYKKTTLGNVPNLFYVAENQNYFKMNESDPYEVPQDTFIFRLRASVLVVWLVTIYAFYLLQEEWIQMVLLRRIWYLQQRSGETINSESEKDDQHACEEQQLEQEWYKGLLLSAPKINERVKSDSNNTCVNDNKEEHLYARHAWIPHPEQPDTVPNVEPYSILIGPLEYTNLRQRQEDEEMTSSQLQLMLQDMVQTLEGALPQEPGYSSPICAITAVPCAKRIGPVWRQWYATATKMRRLLLIQSVRNQLRGQDNVDRNYLQQVFGVLLDDQQIEQAQKSMGPEQMGVYSRELAQAASNFCPYGCFEGQIRDASLSRLEEFESLQKEQVEDAKLELHQRQREFMCQQITLFEEEEGEFDEEMRGLITSKNIDSEWESTLTNGVNRLQQSRKRFVRSNVSTTGLDEAKKQEEGDTIEMMDLTAKPLSAVGIIASPRSGNLRLRQSRRSLLFKMNQIFYQAKYVSIDLYHKYNSISAWRELARGCSRAWTKEECFVVVTFTSRHAAAAARSVTKNVQDIPIPPLADAGSGKLLPFRYFCRPVTVTINNLQKAARLYTLLTFLALMYVFYTLPLTRAANRLDPDTIAYLFPKHKKISKTFGISIPDLLSGLTSSIVWSLFFMLCPQVFKLLAYFGSNATSLAQAERRALQYFWWFMVITAFAGPMLAYWILGAVYYKDETLNGGLRKMLLAIAGTTPTTIAATWINWIIYRFTMILPINFLLQFNTFLFSFLGCNCCARLTIGGGPGGPAPYRIFVDSGVVLMCVVALGPASPLVAPAAMTYFFVCEPILRRNVIFVYRPRYDDGGLRWTFVFDMIVSALIVGQLLLSLQMVLKTAYGSSFVVALAIPTTIWFQISCKTKYMPSFENTALLRTSLLDGSESLDEMTMERREKHLRFLVDAHRAAYIPACIAGTESASAISDTPAVVVPHSIIDSKEVRK